MSKYTTEVRFICENKAGMIESSGFNSVDDIISKSWSKIFTTHCKFFDENYRSVLCQKILKHYYLREICSETVGIWLLWVNTKLEEIMPYYNQLYESQLLKFNPFHDVDITRRHNRGTVETTKTDKSIIETANNDQETNGNSDITVNNTRDITNNNTRDNTNNKTTDSTNNGKRDTTTTNTRIDLYSDTPQGAITGIETETYLTNARKTSDSDSENVTDSNTGKVTENETGKITDAGTGKTVDAGTNKTVYAETVSGTENRNTTNTENGNMNSTEDYLETVIGKQGTENYSTLLTKYRETFLNIDMRVIEEFSDLFFGLW